MGGNLKEILFLIFFSNKNIIMSSVILNSNANSALVNTLLSSSSLSNPNVYSTMEISPPHSTTYSEHQPSNGNVPVRSNTTNYQLNKYGIISQILLTYRRSFTNSGVNPTTNAAGLGTKQNDFFNCVEKVELLSSSRVVSTLTKVDFMAQFSNLPFNKLTVVRDNLLEPDQPSGAVLAAGATTAGSLFTCPLVFGFMRDINTQLNASFLEPMSIRITWGKDWDEAVNFEAGVVGNITEPVLSVRYKNYAEDANAQILAENFDKPSLNMLSSRFYDENRQSVLSTASASTDQSIQIELKNTECVNDFYVLVLATDPNGAGASPTVASDVLLPIPVAITSISFSGSGADILSLNKGQLAYSKIDHDGFSVGVDAAGAGNALNRVVKFQSGVYGYNMLSNTISLREINAPRITVNFNAPNTTNLQRYYAYVVEDTSAIYSITSATGALSNSLSN